MVTIADVFAARRTLAGLVRRTPVLTSEAIDQVAGCTVFAKAECLQVTGSFKARGALNRMSALSEQEKSRGVVAASAGNHALAVAYAAKGLGIAATVCMPIGAVQFKADGVRALGATLLQPGADSTALFAKVDELAHERGLTPIAPFDHPLTVAGAGTLGMEFVEDAPELDDLVVPTSGGGLLSGVLVAVKALSPKTRVIGVQPETCLSIINSLKAGEPTTVTGEVTTIADGLSARRPGNLNFEIIRALVDDVVAIPDEPMRTAMGLIAKHYKLLAEGA
ncbi:MAG TPA: threonine/serine dehydratase, partial [Bacillota bacterium]|nr:threonine/serine dehydratase [Bacillota bacterium]